MRNCIIDGSQGTYLPQAFAQQFDACTTGVDQGDWEILLAGPYHEFYDDAWDSILQDAIITDDDGLEWTLDQDSDLFMVRDTIKVKFVEVRETPIFENEELVDLESEITQEWTEEFTDFGEAAEAIQAQGCTQANDSQAPECSERSIWFDSESQAQDDEDFRNGSNHRTTAFVVETYNLEELQDLWKAVMES